MHARGPIPYPLAVLPEEMSSTLSLKSVKTQNIKCQTLIHIFIAGLLEILSVIQKNVVCVNYC
jgi:hypothetical protein